MTAGKWMRVEIEGEPRYGLIEDDEIVLVDAPPYLAHRRIGTHPLGSAKLLPPVEPANFYAAGFNYRQHVEWANAHFGLSAKVPVRIDIGSRMPSALVGSGADVILPADSDGSFEYEGELVAVIGKTTKAISEADALSCVAGYTLGNDLSERGWQFSDRTLWRAKNADTFNPMGPVVVSGIDPMDQEISVRINGATVSTYNTSGMVFSVSQYISRISQYVTLRPGDVIWFGCDGATLPALKPGDIVEVVNEHIGILSNRIVRAA